MVGARAHVLAERIDEGAVGDGLLAFEASAGEHLSASEARVDRELFGEARLAYSGLASEEGERHGAAQRLLERSLKLFHLIAPADEAAPADAAHVRNDVRLWRNRGHFCRAREDAPQFLRDVLRRGRTLIGRLR